MVNKWISQGFRTNLPTIHIVSDSVGVTGQAIARAAASRFGELNPSIEILSEVSDVEVLRSNLQEHLELHRSRNDRGKIVIYYTMADPELSRFMRDFTDANPEFVAVDLMSEAVHALSYASGVEPDRKAGYLHTVDENYFRRIEAMEFTISHDDGRNPQDLTKADIVLIGVSRSSKTPLSIYLSQAGYKVANIPLDPQSAPPKEIYDVDKTRLFGLMTTPDVLSGIRKRRLGSAIEVAGKYADMEFIYQDLEKSHDLMRKLGCIVIRTDNRAIEETSQEILRYYEMAHPQSIGLRSIGE